MSAALRLLHRLRELGARVRLDGETLHLEAPPGMLDAELRAELRARKPEIVALLRSSAAGAAAAQPRPVARDGDLPLSFAQQRLWFLHELEPDDPRYHIPWSVRLRGALDVDALRGALADLVARHEVLRTTFPVRDGQPRQVVGPPPAAPLPLEDLDAGAGADERARLEALRAQLDAGARRPFDLAGEPPLRARLLRLGDDDHVLQLVFHHIAADGWSLDVVRRELGALWRARRAGARPELPPLPVQVADCAVRQREVAGEQRLADSLEQVRRRLEGAPVLDLPMRHRARPRTRGRGAGRHDFTLESDLAEALDALARGAGTTLFTVLLAGFQELLHRACGQPDVVVGTPVARRDHTGLENLVGCFLNMLPLRTDLAGDPSFRALAGRAQAVVREALEHQELPFERLVEALDPERDSGRNPLFGVFFSLRAEPPVPFELDGLAVEGLDLEAPTARFDLELQLTRTPRGLDGLVLHDAELLEADLVERLFAHWRTLLRAIVREPDRPLSQLSLWEPEARRAELRRWSRPAQPLAGPRTIHGRIAERLRMAPETPAVTQGDTCLTRAEVAARARALARRLRSAGVAPGDLVALRLERGVDLPVAILGVLEAGAAWVPLDSRWPDERTALLLEDTGARVLVTERSLLPPPPGFAGTVLCVDEQASPDPASEPSAPAEVGPEALAYVIHTSGSTGRPKGVEVAHGAVVRFLDAMAREPGLAERDVLLAVTTPSFDISVLELLGPLAVGARVEIATREEAADGARLARRIASCGATHLQATPATWRLLVDAGWEGDGRLVMLCGGEELSRELADELLARGGALWNLYGPTEATVWTTVARVEADGEPVHLGRPLPGAALCVLDAFERLVPPGITGELCIAGSGLARGYRDRPEETRAAFRPGPFEGELSGPLYHTGDLVRVDERGRLRFRGRADHQVKLRGHRIELGEVEAALARHPHVARAAAAVRELSADDRRLEAWVALARDAPPASGPRAREAELRALLAARLPAAMVPGAIGVVDELPLGPSGKLDRARLLALDAGRADRGGRGGREVSGPLEEAVAEAWCELLGLPQVGAHDDFFALGGHSLLATRLVSRIRRSLQVELPLSRVFEHPTVAGLAARVAELRADGGGAPAPPLLPRARAADGSEERLPLSYAQQRLWFLDRLGAGSAYNVRLELRLDGALDVARLEAALARVVERHESLRTRFVEEGGEPRQVIEPRLTVPLEQVDRSAVAPDRRREVYREQARAAAERPFDLERGPLLRALLVRFAPDEHRLLVALHHVVADGSSMGLLARELAAAWRGAELPELPVQVADHALWQRERFAEHGLDASLRYWRSQLAGAPPTLELPTDRPRPAVQGFRGASVRFRLEPELAAALRRLGREHGVTRAMLFLAAWQALLSRLSGQEDVVVGSPVAGRDREEIERAIGFFVNSLALRTDLSGEPSFAELLGRVQRVCLGAYDHQELPFERLVDELAGERDLARTPIFQTVFAMHEEPELDEDCGGLALRSVPEEVTVTRFDLELHLFDGGSEAGGLEGALVYDTDLFDRDTVRRWTACFRTFLEGVARDARTPVTRIPLLGEEERRRVRAEWSAPEPEQTGGDLVHELFATWVRRAPDAPALVHRGRVKTYAELAARARAIARALRARGAGPDRLVGLCAERGFDGIAGLLGILEAGAAWLPLDPAYPAQRLELMLADSRVGLLLTQSHLLERLPRHDAQVLLLDGAETRSADGAAGAEEPRTRSGPDDLAYAIYTSGSTGTPKAALLTHRGLANVAREQERAFGVGPGQRVLQFSSPSFDAATFEVVMALAHGATLVLGDPDELRPGPELVELLRREAVTLVTLPPTVLGALGAPEPGSLPALTTVTVAGEPCPAELVARWGRGRRFFNLYGPTEATIWTTTAELRPGDEPHIGRPIGGVRVHLLDAHGEPVPAGVAGELCIGGAGLARGYLHRPELTAERFVARAPLGGPARRLYRTGDLARRLSDGRLECLGRIDEQVKLHGFRIEPGEIEAALDAHPAVRQSLALVREDRPGERRLVAYVVPDARPGAERGADRDGGGTPDPIHAEARQVEAWRELHGRAYGEAPAPADPTFHVAAWNSSYDGAPLPESEMRAWVRGSVERVLERPPGRVLEVGCGTGLLLFRLAPYADAYLGVDLASEALDHVRDHLARLGGAGERVRLERRAADELGGLPAACFDTVVVNSVAQYFPSLAYLERVVEQAVARCAAGGRVFLGDVRSLPLQRAFQGSVELARAEGGQACALVAQRVRQGLRREQELLVDPRWFVDLLRTHPRVADVRLEPKPGRADNELTRYRYDVTMILDRAPSPADPPRVDWRDWERDALTLGVLERLLADEGPFLPGVLGVRGIANARTRDDARAARLLLDGEPPATVAALRRELESAGSADPLPAVDPEDLRELAARTGTTCHLSLAEGRADGGFDALFVRAADGGAPAELPVAALFGWTAGARRPSGAELANRPLQGRQRSELVPALRAHLEQRLPAHMVPAAFVLLDAFPLTPNGKLDRRALPEPDARRPELARTWRAPGSDAETLLAGVWERVLHLERVGADDNFFELGGDSILSIQVVAAARELGLEIRARDLFAHQTVAELARVARAAGAPAAEQGPVTGAVPLTPIQHWFFAQELEDAHHFDQALALELAPGLATARVREALARLILHHDALRLRFRRRAGAWIGEIGPPPAPDASDPGILLRELDLGAVDVEEREARFREQAARLQASLDHVAGPLVGALLVRGDRADALVLAVHHLAVDGVSWRILLADLDRALAGSGPLPPKTSSWRAWAEALAERARALPSEAGAASRDEPPPGSLAPGGDPAANTVGAARELELVLSRERTAALLAGLPARAGARVDAGLLAPLLAVLADWTGAPRVRVDLEGHGRDAPLGGIDVSRTVGWFTQLAAWTFDVERDGADPLEAARRAGAELATWAERSLDHGLRRLAGSGAPRTGDAPAEVAFNYLGQLDRGLSDLRLLRLTDRDCGPSRGARQRRAHLLEVSATALDGRLRVRWTWAGGLIARAEAQRRAALYLAGLERLADACAAIGDETGRGDAALRGFGWSEDEVADILGEIEKRSGDA